MSNFQTSTCKQDESHATGLGGIFCESSYMSEANMLYISQASPIILLSSILIQ